MSAPPPLHPLNLPEIITRIGECIPLWTGDGYMRQLTPKDLLRCTAVSKTWRQTLLPVFWRLYDGYRMRHLPSEVVAKYSHLFRIITSTGLFKGPFLCKNLIELSTVYGQPWSRELMVSNPRLRRLVWGGPFHRRIETLEQQEEWQQELRAIMRMRHLESINVSGFSLGEGCFVQVLKNNAVHLTRLTLSTIAGLTSVHGLELPSLTDLHITFGGEESQSSPALVDLVTCCPELRRLSLSGTRVPGSSHHHHHQNLVTVNMANGDVENTTTNNTSTSSSPAPKVFDFPTLSRNLSDHCPHLSSIKFSSHFTSIIRHHSSFEGSDFATLIQSARRLEEFSADITLLDDVLTDALIAHAGSLEHLNLNFHKTDQEQEPLPLHLQQQPQAPPPMPYNPWIHQDHSNVNMGVVGSRAKEVPNLKRIKCLLSRLKELNLSWEQSLMMAMEAEMEAFLEEEPWGCLELERLSVNGISRGASSTTTLVPADSSLSLTPSSLTSMAPSSPNSPYSSNTSSASSSTCSLVLAESEWQPKALEETPRPCSDQFRTRLFSHVQPLRELKEIRLNDVPYTRKRPVICI